MSNLECTPAAGEQQSGESLSRGGEIPGEMPLRDRDQIWIRQQRRGGPQLNAERIRRKSVKNRSRRDKDVVTRGMVERRSGAVSVFRLMLEDESGRVRDGGGYKLIVTSGHDATAQTVRAVCLPSGVTPAESR